MYRSPTRRWVAPKCTVLDLPEGIIGPFVELDDGALLTVKDGAVRRSHDDGKSWSAPEPIHRRTGPRSTLLGAASSAPNAASSSWYSSTTATSTGSGTTAPASRRERPQQRLGREERGRGADVDRPPDDHGGVQRGPDHHDRDAQRQDRRSRPEALVQPRPPT